MGSHFVLLMINAVIRARGSERLSPLSHPPSTSTLDD